MHEFTAGLEALYAELMETKFLLLNTAQAAPGMRRFEYIASVLDEDRGDGYELMAMRVGIEG